MNPTMQQIIQQKFLSGALNQYFKGDVKIFKYTTSSLLDSGHCSDLLRILITYSIDDGLENHTLSVIAKYLPEDEAQSDFVAGLKCFEHEVGFYSEVLPAIKNLDCAQKVAPDTIYISFDPSPLLLLEDLTALNYKMHEREFGLNLDHCLIVVEKMAYFHASTAAVYDKNQGIMEMYSHGLFANSPMVAQFISVCYGSLIELCEKNPVWYKYLSKLKLAQDRIAEKVFACNKRSTKFNVLNHGDAWINNFMFSYTQNGTPDDVVFVDFQFPIFSSPVLDFHYFWSISTSLEVKQNHREAIISHYLTKLQHNLMQLGVSVTPPTRQEFDEDFRSRAAHGFAATVICTPFMRTSGKHGISLVDYFDEGDKEGCRYRCFHRDAYIKELTHLLPFYDGLGVFD